MAALATPCRRGPHRGLAWLLGLAALLAADPLGASAPELAAPEYQIKAVFLFYFTQFVEWPPQAIADPNTPFVIGVLGDDPFGGALDETVRGEKVNGRSIAIARFARVDEVRACHILFVSDSQGAQLEGILSSLKGRSILTVSDIHDFSRRGGMICFVTENNKVRLRINNEAARSAGLTISSKLLRPSQAARRGKAGP